MAHARSRRALLDDDIQMFERQRMHKLELAIAILVALIAAFVIAAHLVGQGLPGPYFS